MRHKSVARCAAFAVADERLGEKVCLSVIFHDGESAEAASILAHLHAEGLSRYDMPEYFIPMDAYPLTASGKIDASWSSGPNPAASRRHRCAGREVDRKKTIFVL